MTVPSHSPAPTPALSWDLLNGPTLSTPASTLALHAALTEELRAWIASSWPDGQRLARAALQEPATAQRWLAAHLLWRHLKRTQASNAVALWDALSTADPLNIQCLLATQLKPHLPHQPSIAEGAPHAYAHAQLCARAALHRVRVLVVSPKRCHSRPLAFAALHPNPDVEVHVMDEANVLSVARDPNGRALEQVMLVLDRRYLSELDLPRNLQSGSLHPTLAERLDWDLVRRSRCTQFVWACIGANPAWPSIQPQLHAIVEQSVQARLPFKRGSGKDFYGRAVGVGDRGNQHGNAGPYKAWTKQGLRLTAQARVNLLEAEDTLIDWPVGLASVLLPGLVSMQRHEATAGGLPPRGSRGFATTAGAAIGYCSPLHRETRDPHWSYGLDCSSPAEWDALPPKAFWFAVPDLDLIAPNVSGAFMMWRGMQHLHGTVLGTDNTGQAILPDASAPAPHGIAVYAKPLLARNASRLAKAESGQLPQEGPMDEVWEIGQPLWQLGVPVE